MKESREEYVGGFGGRKVEEKCGNYIIISKSKKKKIK